MATLSLQSAPQTSRAVTQRAESVQSSIKKLSSASRLSNPSDDSAGVAVSANLSAVISRLQASSENLQNVASFAQTTDGFLNTVQQQLSRMSELAQRATDGTLTSDQRATYNTEFQQIKNQISNVTQNASFNGTSIFQNESISTALENGSSVSFQTNATGTPASLGITASSVDTTSNAQTAISSINQAIQTLSSRRAEVGADISQINFHTQNTRTESIHLTEANSRIADLDIAEESTKLSSNSILEKASISVLAQANQSSQHILKLLS